VDEGAGPGRGVHADTQPVRRRHRQFTGPTFSPDGKILFVNIQAPGITLAITGPWEKYLG
jgi:secreted PhoX family phosphatase